MVRAFAGFGHDVRLLAARLGGEPCSLPAEVINVALRPIDSSLVSDENSARRRKEERNIAVARDLECEIDRQHARKPFDLLYERHSLWSAAAARKGRELGIPVALELNSPLVQEQRQYRKLVLLDQAEQIEREVFASVDMIFAVSEEVADYAVARGARPDRVSVQPNGVNPDTFSRDVAPAAIDKPAGGVVIGFSGSLKPWHGLEDLLEAFVIVNGELPDTRLLVVGDGPLLTWSQGFARGARLDGKIIATGWQPHAKLPSYINAMDIACAPYPDIEGFYFSPLKLFEYMACGRAIVASGIGQIRTVIDDGVDGVLTVPGNVERLAASLITLATDQKLRRKLGERACASISGRSWQDNARTVLALTASGSANAETRQVAL